MKAPCRIRRTARSNCRFGVRRESDNPATLQAYLEKYPHGEFKSLAEIRSRDRYAFCVILRVLAVAIVIPEDGCDDLLKRVLCKSHDPLDRQPVPSDAAVQS